jgi:hypothetical protein
MELRTYAPEWTMRHSSTGTELSIDVHSEPVQIACARFRVLSARHNMNQICMPDFRYGHLRIELRTTAIGEVAIRASEIGHLRR